MMEHKLIVIELYRYIKKRLHPEMKGHYFTSEILTITL